MGEKQDSGFDEVNGDNTGSEEAQIRHVTRRDFMRRAALTLGGAVASSSLFPSLGCDTPAPAVNSTETPPTTALVKIISL